MIDGRSLQGNRLGDPHRRPLLVYLPPDYDRDRERRFPTVYVLQGLLGQVDVWLNRRALRPTFPEAVDEVFAGGTPPCVVVFVDCWTSVGGSQFLDSPGTGRYHTFLCEEVVPFVDSRWRTLGSAPHRGLLGHSSGGYGAMVTCMLRPDLFGGFASHAGDALFEMCYQRDFATCAKALRDHHGGSFERFWEDFRARPPFTRPGDFELLNAWCMACCYSTDDDGTVRVPFDQSGRLRPEVWERWLAWDPVRMIPRYGAAMRGLRAVYLDAGRQDEYGLDLGAEAVRGELMEQGVDDLHFELFEGRHSGIDHRYPIALTYLAHRLAP